MEFIVNSAQVVGAFAFGIAARLLVILLLLGALVLPVLVAFGAVSGFGWLRRRLLGLEKVGNVLYRPGAYYAKGHTWLLADKGGVKVGLDDLGQQLLPCSVSVTLPRVKAPINGRVVKLNSRLVKNPSLVKHDNYARGWLFQMEPEDDRYIDLPIGLSARKWLATESLRLDRFLELRLGTASADGGDWLAPAPSLLTAQQWDELVRSFL